LFLGMVGKGWHVTYQQVHSVPVNANLSRTQRPHPQLRAQILPATRGLMRGPNARYVKRCGSATLKPEEPVNVYLAVCLGNNTHKVRSAMH
jgi:hypothetical protein